MRRAVVEFSRQDMAKLLGIRMLAAISSFEIVHYFSCDPRETAGIGRVALKDESAPLESLVCDGGFSRVELLSRVGSTRIVYFECKPIVIDVGRERWPRVYACTPSEFREERGRITFIGKAGEIKRFFKLLERRGVRTRVLSLTDETLDPNSPMTSLTEKQRQILLSAYRLGFYDVPRRVDSEKLAKVLELDKSTVVEHLRKAEKRLLKQVIGF